ncbi:MAG: sigma 54-interacting transcriptional regulator [Desulfopila sp.]
MISNLSVLIVAVPSANIQALADHVKDTFAATITTVSTSTALHQRLKDDSPDILILDTEAQLPEPGLEIIRQLRASHGTLLILPLIPASRRDLIKQLLSLDVFFYLYTPIEPAETTIALTRAIEHLSGQRKKEAASRPRSQPTFHGMIGSSPPMRKLFELITKIAEDDDSTVLIRGESGTGKEMVAKAIHGRSGRQHKNFVPVNCAAIPDDLLESELFGYTKGAFTGATTNKIGRIQYADGGTLFLDEIGDMKPALQAKLLRVLQEKEFEPVGALKPIPVDTRVLAATHCDLEQLVHAGQFRQDLYYRLSVVPLHLPPLKERQEDIPLLVDSFTSSYAAKRNREPLRFTPAALAALHHFEWHGNVRELENLIQHMSILFDGRVVDFDDLPDKFHHLRDLVANFTPPVAETTEMATTVSATENEPSTPAEREAQLPSAPALSQTITDIPWHEGKVDFRELINTFETELIVYAMKLTDGNKKEAARLLNLKRTTLLEKIKKKSLNNVWEE